MKAWGCRSACSGESSKAGAWGVERVGSGAAEVVWNLVIKAETLKNVLMIFSVSADILSP